MTRVYTLYRVSTVGQVDHDDIPMQRIECHSFVERQPGWEIIQEFYEKGVSGYKVSSESRDAIMKIKADALAGKFDVLLVFMFDRLGRRDNETPFVVQWFVSHGVQVWSVKEGEQRFDNHVDKLLNYIRFWQASGESEKTAIRVKTRQQQMTMAGEYRGGYIPFGFDGVFMGRINKKGLPVRDLVRNEAEAAIKAECYHKIVDEGYGGNRLANWLNSRGIKPKRGTPYWRANSVRAMIGNPIDRGQMHMGDTLSEPIESLRIVDDYYYYKAIDIMKQRGRAYDQNRSIALRTDGGGLLTGLIYCADCGGRMCINHCKKTRRTRDGKPEYHWNVYRCYKKTVDGNACTGQTTYNSDRVEEIVIGLVRCFFAKIHGIPQVSKLRSAMVQETAAQKKALDDAEAAVNKATKAVSALEEEAVKALTGDSQLSLDLVSQLLKKQQAVLDQAKDEYQRILQANQDDAEVMDIKLRQADKIQNWAQVFDIAPRETKQMILANIIERVTVGRGYKVNIEMKLTARQFLEPDAKSQVTA